MMALLGDFDDNWDDDEEWDDEQEYNDLDYVDSEYPLEYSVYEDDY